MTEKKTSSKKPARVSKKKIAHQEAVDKKQTNTNILTPHELGWQRPDRVNLRAYATWIRALLQNWRQGTVGCKTRAEVSFSRKKPWKQKGTGRARVGSARSPLWRSGGIIFGPQPRTRVLKIPQNVRQGILQDLFWNLAYTGHIFVVDFESDAPKTARAVQALKQAGLTKNTTVLLAPHDVVAQASFANISHVQVLFFDQLNAYNVACSTDVAVLRKDIEQFKNMVAQWK